MRFSSSALAFTLAALVMAAGGSSFAQIPDAAREPEAAIKKMAPLPPPVPPELAVMSVQCAVPAHEIATPAPLPITAARLQAGKNLRILAIGSASVFQRESSKKRPSDGRQFASLIGKVMKDVKVDIVNRGVSGEVASTTAQRLINEAAMVRPDMVLWQLGTVDAVSRVPISEFIETVRETVRTLRRHNIDVILVGLQYTPQFARDAHYFATRQALVNLAAQEQLVLVRRYNVMDFIARTKANLRVSPDSAFSVDDLGPQCMAEHVAQAVIASVFLRRGRKPGNKS